MMRQIQKLVLPVFLLFMIALASAGLAQTTATTTSSSTATNTGTSTSACSSASPSGSPTPVTISLPCLDASGNIQGNSGINCKSLLPSCSALAASITASVKATLAQKIYGYIILNQDVSLGSASTSAGSAPSGPALAIPVCSVTGASTLKYTGTNPVSSFNAYDKNRTAFRAAYQTAGFEIVSQVGGKQLSCGVRPDDVGVKENLQLKFNSLNGSSNPETLWAAYLLGAKPWIIRKVASDTLTQMTAGGGISLQTTSDVAQAVQCQQQTMASIYQGLNANAQASNLCSQNSVSMLQQCQSGQASVNAPSLRMCQMAISQQAMSTGAFPNIVVTQIMNKAQADFQTYFASSVFAQTEPEIMAYLTYCNNNESGTYRKAKAMGMSCLTDGAQFYADNSSHPQEHDGSGKQSRQGNLAVAFDFSQCQPNTPSQNCIKPVAGVVSPKPGQTINLGMAGFIEAKIRKYCGQTKYTDDNVCDQIGITQSLSGLQSN